MSDKKLIPVRWDELPKEQQRSCYWVAIPIRHADDILDAMPYEIVYVYFDGHWSVLRPGVSRAETLESFLFLKQIERFDVDHL